jgi:hypothetical protein
MPATYSHVKFNTAISYLDLTVAGDTRRIWFTELIVTMALPTSFQGTKR